MEQNCKLFCLPFLAFSLISFCSSAQFVKAIKPGVYTSYGYSKARQPLSEIAKSQQSPIQQRFMSGGVYLNFIFRDRISSKQLSALQYVKLDIGTTLRSGLFEPTTGNVYRIDVGGFDFGLMLPVLFKLSDNVDVYSSTGPIATSLWFRDVTPTQDLPEIDKFKIGLGFEMGIWIRKHICVGYKATTQWGSYAFRSNALYLSVNFRR
ncbi:MAG: hypothetical protein R2820_05645 [Cyclobacteriaceae bacterium]|nr:hypothetical protein [Cyclobacteriaceae bacterium]